MSKKDRRKRRLAHLRRYSGRKKDSEPYFKTDGEGRVCLYSAQHRFIRFATEFEAENF